MDRRDAVSTPLGAAHDARRDPSTHQLRLFLVLAEELHFGRAAARLFMTQPALSHQLRALEERLGVPLVTRTSRSVELTQAGSALIPEARAAIAAMARVSQVADRHAREVRGHVRIGCFQAKAALPIVRRLLEEFQRRHPDVILEMRTLDFVGQTRALLDGEVDAVFCYLPVPEGIQAQVLAQDARVVGIPAGHPLAARTSVTLDELDELPVIGNSEQIPAVWRDFWIASPRPSGKPVRVVPHGAPDFETVLSAVALGQGICFAPAAARLLYPRPGVAYLDVPDLSPCSSALAWQTRRRDTPAVTALREAARVAV